MKNYLSIAVLLFSVVCFSQEEPSTDEAAKLAKAIQNPIASLISVPLQNNTDFGIGPDNRTKNVLNIQPVVPLSLSENTKLIVRTIIPIVNQPISNDKSQFGLGDMSLSLFFTPAKPGKLIWGAGPALGIPTGMDEVLGSQKWSAGPSVIGLIQPEGWTMGMILQNTWSYAGHSDRSDVNFFYSQVFVTKNLPKGWYINTAPIITANWEAEDSSNQWTVPLGAGFGKLFKIGNMPINGQAGYYNYVVAPDNGPDWQLRVQLSLLFPPGKKK